MTSITATLPRAETSPFLIDGDQRITLFDVPWETYESLLEANSERPIRLTYEEGTLEIVTLSRYHERLSRFFHRLIGALSEELNIEICSTGSTTMRLAAKKRGAEADESYYVRHESLVRREGRTEFDPALPPDLAVEIDLSTDSARRLAVYAALGIAEVWQYDGRRVMFQALRGGKYRTVKRSLSFPNLAATDFQRFLVRFDSDGEMSLVRQFREWVREAMLGA